MKKSPKIPKFFSCKLCDYNTCNSKDFNKHLNTDKHLNRTKLNDLEQKNPENPKEFVCKYCNKCYKARNSLWYHEQKCTQPKEQSTDKELIMMLIKDNSELKTMIMKVLENGNSL